MDIISNHKMQDYPYLIKVNIGKKNINLAC